MKLMLRLHNVQLINAAMQHLHRRRRVNYQ